MFNKMFWKLQAEPAAFRDDFDFEIVMLELFFSLSELLREVFTVLIDKKDWL